MDHDIARVILIKSERIYNIPDHKVNQYFIEICGMINDKRYEEVLKSGSPDTMGKLDIFYYLIYSPELEETTEVFEAMLKNELYHHISFLLGKEEKKWENFMARCGDDLRTMRHEMLDDVWANTMMMHARSLQRELMSIQPLLIEIFSAKFLCCFRKQNYIYLQELNLLFELEKELYIWSTSRNNHEKLLQICC